MDTELILQINELYAINNEFDSESKLDLPQIAVVGDQSAGKSTLLHSFIGKKFLPTACGRSTKRPINLQLIYQEKKGNDPLEYAVFPGENLEKHSDFDVVNGKLLAYMDEVKDEQVVLDKPITICVYSPNVVTLTVFDLPGIIAVKTKNEPASAPNTIRNLVKKYIEKENMIILAVAAANVQLGTSNALLLAEEVDPDYKRTILAVTKLDLVAKNKKNEDEAVNILMGEEKKYKEGIVGMISHTQEEHQDLPIHVLRQMEANDYRRFEKRPENFKLGPTVLQRLLNRLLIKKIAETDVPKLKKKIDQQISECDLILQMYGGNTPEIDKLKTLQEAITNFCENFRTAIIGNASDLREIQDLIPHRSNYDIFFSDFPRELQGMRTACLMPNDATIQKYIMDAMGPQPHLDVPHNVFQTLVTIFIEKTREPSKNAANNINDSLSFTAEKCKTKISGRFPKLVKAIREKTAEFMKEKLKKTKEVLKYEIDMETKYINVNHPDFDAAYEAAAKMKNPVPQSAGTAANALENRKKETNRISIMLADKPKDLKFVTYAYIDIIYKNTLAMVPKVIYFNMINEVTKHLEPYLLSHFQNTRNTDITLFDESPDVIAKVTEAQKKLETCEKAKKILTRLEHKWQYNL